MSVIVVGGPAGSGKTTIAELLAQHYNCPFIEGDLLHPQHNIDKMSKGQPLTDDDRWGWLELLSEKASDVAFNSSNSSGKVVVSCSILKKSYRHHIRQVGHKVNSSVQFRFVFLHTSYDELVKRVLLRQGHYMKSEMVRSQFDIMEPPKDNELVANGGDAVTIESTGETPQDIFQKVLQTLD